MRHCLCRIVSAIIAISCSSPLFAAVMQIGSAELPIGVTTITFETTPQGNPITHGTLAGSIWSSLGVTFDNNDAVGGFGLHSGVNALTGDNNTSFQPILGTFNPGTFVVGAWGFDFVMEIFNVQGGSLGSATFTDGSAGLFGGASEYGFLGFQSTTTIAKVQFRDAFPNDGVYGFHIDDLSFMVPEPSAWILALFGGLLLMRRRLVG